MKNQLLHTILFSLIVVFSIQNVAAEDVDIGSGYRCSGTSILSKSGKTVKLGVAKTKIQNKIDNVVGSNAKAKAKKSALKTVKANLTKCSKGQLSSGNPGEPGGEAPGDDSAVLGRYTGTLTRVSINDKKGGCADSATPTWSFRILYTSGGDKIYATGGTPFLGASLGGATTSGFKFSYSKTSILSGVDSLALTGTNVTDTSATITLTEKHSRLVPKRPRGYEEEFACESTYTGEFTRDKDAVN